MITEAMLDILVKFNGDIDGFARGGNPKDRSLLDDEAWYQISTLLQELGTAASGLTTQAYEDCVEAKLIAQSSTPRVSERIRQLASMRSG